jgi:hypothetical protein
MGFDDVLFRKEQSSLKAEIKHIKIQMNKYDQVLNFKDETIQDIKEIKLNIEEIDNQNTEKILKIKNELNEMKNIKDLVGNNRTFKTIGECIKET